MITTAYPDVASTDLTAPERNRYRHGMMMSAARFSLESDYFIQMRRLINRMVLGYGVVCGLDVLPGPDKFQIIVTPGLALDKHGNEIVVPEMTGPLTIPETVVGEATQKELSEAYHDKCDPETGGCVQVMLYYRECLVDPVPTLAGDCASPEPCQPSRVREQFGIRFEAGCVENPSHDCRIAHLMDNSYLHDALAHYVTQECPPLLCEQAEIPLANIVLDREHGHSGDDENIDITVRPIVYSLDLLFETMLGLARERSRGRGGKS